MPISNGGGGGGAVEVTTRESLNTGGTVLIANAGQARMPWAHAADSVLVDLTDPTAPAVIASGVYACSVIVFPADPMTAGGFWNLDFELDFFGAAQNVNQDAPATAADVQPPLPLSLTYYIPAGGQIVAAVTNNDGVAAINFRGVAMYIQRLA